MSLRDWRPSILPLSIVVVIGIIVAPSCTEADDPKYDLETLKPGERALVPLPIEFEVGPTNRLYLYGERVYEVRLASTPGDSLYLNEVPVLPCRPVKADEELSEQRYVQLYGHVPFVQELMASGQTAAEAGKRFNQERDRAERLLREAYSEAREAGADRGPALDAAFSRLREFDEEELVDWERNTSAWGLGNIDLFWKGIQEEDCLILGDTQGRKLRPFPTQEEKRLWATELYELLAFSDAPCWRVISQGVVSTICGHDAVSRALAQLEAAKETGTIGVQPLLPVAVREILEKQEDGR